MLTLPACTVASHEALKADPARWSALPLVGYQPDRDENECPAPLEIRNCTCGSSLCLRVDPAPLSWHLLDNGRGDDVTVYARHWLGECVVELCNDLRGFKVMETLAGVPLDAEDTDELCHDVKVYLAGGWQRTSYRDRNGDESMTRREAVAKIKARRV